MCLPMLVWDTLEDDVGSIGRSHGTWKPSIRVLGHVLTSIVCTRWTQDIPLVQCSAGKVKECMKELANDLLACASVFRKVV